ncbi:LytR/AlgR family response regulator transcription factor [Runella sp.]|uniref:LytR/AlgR family response regulator transcription factor n=1 Tax=Runella sp. TaxID=1960881 RepID=UPI003D0AA639
MNILIVEDEELTARKLQRLTPEIEPNAIILGILTSIEESVTWLRANPAPDLILLDIELADGQSFEIFKQVPVQSPVIFTTAYDDFAIKAFKVNSIDYLLKPIKAEELRRALHKLNKFKETFSNNSNDLQHSIRKLLSQLAPAPVPVYRERFLIRQGQKMFSLPTKDIAYFYTRNKLSFAKSWEGRDYLVDYTLDEIFAELDPRLFFRLNRQVIASVNSIEKVNLYFNSKLKLQLLPAFDEEVIVGREKASDFKTWLGE